MVSLGIRKAVGRETKKTAGGSLGLWGQCRQGEMEREMA